MKPKMVLLLCLSMFLGSTVFGQTDPPKREKIFITGAVYDSETKAPLTNARFGFRKAESFVTQANGRFSLFGLPGDTITYKYLGYKDMHIIIPDTLKSPEYLMGVFMPKDTILIPEIIIFSRTDVYPSVVTDVKMDDKMYNQAQKNVNKAVFQGLTQPVKNYDAEMNGKKTLRGYEMKAQNNGLLVTQENSVGVSTLNYQTQYLQFGMPAVRERKITNEMVRQIEIDMILANHEIKRIDSTKKSPDGQ